MESTTWNFKGGKWKGASLKPLWEEDGLSGLSIRYCISLRLPPQDNMGRVTRQFLRIVSNHVNYVQSD